MLGGLQGGEEPGEERRRQPPRIGAILAAGRGREGRSDRNACAPRCASKGADGPGTRSGRSRVTGCARKRTNAPSDLPAGSLAGPYATDLCAKIPSVNGSTLAKLLSDADLSAAWLARRLGVAVSTVTRWIGGVEIPPEQADRIDAIFAASLRDLPKR